MTLSKYVTHAVAALGLLFASVAIAKPVNINTASANEIAESLAGIGPATANAIVAYRNQNGAFSSLDDLLVIKGIGPSTLNKIGSEVLFGNANASNLNDLLNTTPASAGGLINLNTASAEELSTLAGIGASTAAKIVTHRETYGPFNTVDELANVSGIGASTVEKNRQLMTVGSATGGGLLDNLLTPEQPTVANANGLIDINTADAATLSAGMVGVGDATAAAIVAYRNANGPFQSVDDLTNVKGIGPATISKNDGLLTVSSAANNNGGLLDNIFGNETAAPATTAAPASGIVNINTASADELAAGLSGIGAATAKKIVAYRQANGDFKSVEELGNVSGIGAATVAANLDNMIVGVPVGKAATVELTAPINVNTASFEELQALTYIGPVKAQRIIDYRSQQGRIDSIEELMSIKGIGDKTIEKNSQWIRF